MALKKAVFSIGLCIFLYVCTATASNCTNHHITNPCIVNVTNPNCTKCVDGSYAPDPNDPTMFYQCSNGNFYPMHCEPDTVWNETTCTCIRGEVTTVTNPYDSKSVSTTINSTTPNPSTTTPPHTTPKLITGSFDAASFGGGIGAGFGISLIVLLLVRCCCSSPSRNGYEEHI